MKIGLVLDDTLDTPDGVQQYMLSVGTWLTAHGHEVHYLVGETRRTDLPHVHSLSRNLRVKFNGNAMSMPLPASRRRLRRLLKAEAFDVLHVQVPYSPFMAGRLLRLAPARTAVVGTFHVLPYGWLERLGNRLLAILNRRTAKRFSAMIAASQPAADFARACYEFDSQVIPHPFDYQAFSVTVPASKTVNLVYLARLVERKGAAWFLRAVAELHARGKLGPEVRVLIGGKGPLKAQLEAYVASAGLGDHVTFAGFVPEAEKAMFLAQADIAVFPSTSGESFGISIIEALAAVRGVVLAGDNPGYRAAMSTADQLFDPTDTAAFAGLLQYWLDRPEARQAAAAAQKAYARRYDADTICRQVEAVYEHALQSVRKS